jgi:hypothetical protein
MEFIFEWQSSDNALRDAFLISKFKAKFFENLAHLYCEPLHFEKGEECLDAAEKEYQEDTLKDHKLLYLRFKLKKASFYKKYGFFRQAIE